MLAITGKDKISIITKLELYQFREEYIISYNNRETYARYDNKEEARKEYIMLANELKKDKLKIIADKLEELSEVSENDRLWIYVAR